MKIKKTYNIWADIYDTNSNKTRDLDRRATIETLNKFNFSKVIELGCGTGKNINYLLTKADEIIGLDFSQRMLNIALSKIKDDRVDFRKTDITSNWNVENTFAELVTCNLVLEHIKDLNFVFNQANQKLKNWRIFFY